MSKSIYQEHGFADRIAYLSDLADEYGLDLSTVEHAAEVLGQNEDFDGLLSILQEVS